MLLTLLLLTLTSLNRTKWNSTKTGELTMKSAYNYITKFNTNKNEASFGKQIWNLNTMSKVNMFCWKILAGALSLGQKMSTYVKDSNPFCLLCDNSIMEDEMHLFVNCFFTRKIWDLFGFNNIYNSRSHKDIQSWFNFWMNNKDFKNSHDKFSFIIWSIWKFRNSVNYDNVMPVPQNLFESITTTYQKYVSTINNPLSSSRKKNITPSKINSIVNNKSYDWFIYFDVSYMEADFTMGYAISIMDNTGNRKYCRAANS
ncbi:uncharacterized protein LOC113358926 [Papaver somniferum]|uniref:uncharacterized protein LOC113358926 n=1 Tax=Papaver somniferum TaxID=3469 RepID=UPI000E702A26|nr:uncharacterized protein LOC113358926 [Papaver somniferum]